MSKLGSEIAEDQNPPRKLSAFQRLKHLQAEFDGKLIFTLKKKERKERKKKERKNKNAEIAGVLVRFIKFIGRRRGLSDV